MACYRTTARQNSVRFEAGKSAALTSLMAVEKAPDELDTFAAPVGRGAPIRTRLLSRCIRCEPTGRNSRTPTSEEADKPPQRMVESVKAGSFGPFISFDRQRQLILFN